MRGVVCVSAHYVMSDWCTCLMGEHTRLCNSIRRFTFLPESNIFPYSMNQSSMMKSNIGKVAEEGALLAS